jgi:hypothetical protein
MGEIGLFSEFEEVEMVFLFQNEVAKVLSKIYSFILLLYCRNFQQK